MKVENMMSNKGNDVVNQFIIKTDNETIFQSYDSIIAKIDNDNNISLDARFWNYSRTTSKYRNQFLNMTTKEIEKGIKNNEIELVNLNA